MTILFTTDHYPPSVNGIVSHVILVRQELQRRGHRVIVVSPKIGRTIKRENDVFHLPSFPLPTRAKDLFTIPFDVAVERKIMDIPIDIFHNHLFLTGYFGMRIAEKKGIPSVATFHTFMRQYVDWIAPWAKTITHPVTNFIARDYFKQHDIVIAPSVKAVDELKRIKVTTPVRLVHNGIDLNFYRGISSERFITKFLVDTNRPLILLVGIIEKGKNVDLAIRAIDKLRKHIPNVQMAVIGDGRLRPHMERLVHKLHLSRHVFFTGFQDASVIASANKAADIAILTSDTDTLSTVLMEALAAGKPIVAVNDKAVIELVHSGKNGYLVKKRPTELAHALETILSNKEKSQTFCKESILMSKNFSLIKCVDNLEKLYYELIEKRKTMTLQSAATRSLLYP